MEQSTNLIPWRVGGGLALAGAASGPSSRSFGAPAAGAVRSPVVGRVLRPLRLLLGLLPIGLGVLLAVPARLEAQTTFFSDSFNRAADLNLDSSTNGMGGLLVANRTLTASNIWLEPTDLAKANDSNTLINATQQLQMGGLGNTVNIVLNQNFAGVISSGMFSISLALKSPGPAGTTPLERYQGIGVGFSLAEGNVSADRVLNLVADLFVAETTNGMIRINDNSPSTRVQSGGVITASTNVALNASTANFVPGTLRLDLTFTNVTLGATVVYNVLFDGGSGFSNVVTGRTFTWSDNAQLYVGIEDRSAGVPVIFDDLNISGTVSTNLPINAQLTATPNTVSATNVNQAVTLNWSGQFLPPGSTYTLTANQPVTFPGGGQSGSAAAGSGSVAATVNGTLGNTVFNLYLSNAVPQLVATSTVTVASIIAPSTNRPNILVILYDDTGWGDFGCYGSPIQTPNIDALAAGGLRFREFYNVARCSPTRCSLLTGNYPQQVAVTPTASLPPLRTDNNITVAELLGSSGPLGVNGYRTYKAGKWHLGTTPGQIPTSRGFDHNYGQGIYGAGAGVTDPIFGMWIETDFNLLSADNANSPTPTDSEIPERTYAPTKQFHYSDGIGDYCVDYINNCYGTHNDGRPFFIYMPFNAPHFPVAGPAALANKYTDVGDTNPADADVIHFEDGWDVIRQQTYQRQLAMGALKPGTALSPKSRSPTPSGNAAQQPIDDWNTLSQAQRNDLARREAIYASAIELDDQNIGKVVNRLKELGQFDNTLIFVLCDNGANWEGGEFGNSDSSTFTPWVTADLPAMGQPVSAYNALGIATNKYAQLHQGAAWANVSNVPFRLYKHFDHNGGIRSPLVVSWPAGLADSVKGTWTDERGHLIDIMATIADVTGAVRPTNFNGHAVLPLQGLSLRPTFSGGQLPIRDLGFEHEQNRAYYRGNWKLVTKNYAFSDGSSPANQLELYDMVTDPTELTNQAVNQPVVLARLIDAWNAWAANVGLPTDTNYWLTSFAPPQISPAPFTNDLFVDNFNRADNSNANASTNGMSGSRLPAANPPSAYYEGYQATGAGSISLTNQGLLLAAGGGTSENGLQYNFIGPDITGAGGFSVQIRIDDINAFTPDPDCYAGFAVGLSQPEAAGGADIASPSSFRGNGISRGVADCFVELDYLGHVKLWTNGVLLASVPMGKNHGTLLAGFATTNFAAGSPVTVTVFLDGQVVNLNPGGTNVTRTFTWQHDNANYLGLSARATAPAVSYVKLDNLAVRTYPLAYALASEYAMEAGLNSPTNAPNADPFGTGDNNLIEWLKGGQFGANDASRQLLMLGPTARGEFRFDHFELTAAAQYGVAYLFICSTNLVNWNAFTPETMSTVPDVPGYALVESRVPPAVAAGQPQLFIRILERIDSSSTLPAALLVAPAAPMSKAQAQPQLGILPDD